MTHEVAGWSGLAVARGAGIKPALLRDPSTGRYANAGSPADWHDEAEIASFARQGLLTRRELHVKALPDGVVLYAAYEFIGPREPDRLILDPTPLQLAVHAEPLVWVGYMPLSEALDLLRSWGVMLIADANTQLLERTREPDRRLAAARALSDARRGRFCIDSRQDPQLRYDMFRVMAIATRILEQQLEPVYRDAAIDLPKSQVEQLRRDVEAFAPRNDTSTDRQVSPFGRYGHGPRTSTEPLGVT
jgi:hypothetical protein